MVGADPEVDARIKTATRSVIQCSSGRRIGMAASLEILDFENVRFAARRPKICWADRRFAVAARYVEHVGRLAEARHAAVERPHERLALRDRGAQMRRAGRKVAVMEVVGFYAAFDQGTHEFAECRLIVVDAA